MDNSKKSKILELKNEIERLEEEMLRIGVGNKAYNNLKNEQWDKINKLKKLELNSKDY